MPTTCPSCSSELSIARLSCALCGTQVEGGFELPALLTLGDDDLRFVTEFVLASGSLKEMAKIRRQSYHTIRSRLDAIITALKAKTDQAESEESRILDSIAKGELSVAEAIKYLIGGVT